MAFLKIVAVTFLATISTTKCSLIAPAFAPLPAVRYTQVAPPSVLPFSAQVNTFTRNLHVFDAPYAAGVIPGPPAIVQRALLPAPVAPFAPAPVFPAPIAPAFHSHFIPSAAPVFPAPYAGFPYPAGIVAPVARSVHAHAVGPALAPAPLLG